MTPRIFLTDYESYNNGNQFRHGHWVDLDDFASADDLNEYITDHFEDIGITDPEVMITDFEGFPHQFYLESGMDFEKLYKFLEEFPQWDEADSWACTDYCDGIYDNDLDVLFTSPNEAVRAVCFGEYNYNDEFVRFNGYGNLESGSLDRLIDIDDCVYNWIDAN